MYLQRLSWVQEVRLTAAFIALCLIVMGGCYSAKRSPRQKSHKKSYMPRLTPEGVNAIAGIALAQEKHRRETEEHNLKMAVLRSKIRQQPEQPQLTAEASTIARIVKQVEANYKSNLPGFTCFINDKNEQAWGSICMLNARSCEEYKTRAERVRGYAGQCWPRSRAACHTYFDVATARYEAKCYPTWGECSSSAIEANHQDINEIREVSRCIWLPSRPTD